MPVPCWLLARVCFQIRFNLFLNIAVLGVKLVILCFFCICKIAVCHSAILAYFSFKRWKHSYSHFSLHCSLLVMPRLPTDCPQSDGWRLRESLKTLRKFQMI